MSEPADFDEERIDRALGMDGLPGGSDRLRASVLAQTVGAIRRRRRLKQWMRAACVLGVYLAGIATPTLWPAVKAVMPRPPTEQAATSRGGIAAGQQEARPELTRPQPPRYIGVAERRSAATEPRGVRGVQQDADRQLLEYGDVESAVQGYSRVLAVGSPKRQVVPSENDTWLLMAMKNAKSKELSHERIQD